MRVLYDDQAFSLQEYGGVSRYHYELLRHATWPTELSVALSNNLYLPGWPQARHRQFLPTLPLPSRWRVIHYVNRRASVRALRRGQFDVFHPTLTDHDYFLPLLQGRPLVITVHDMIPALFPEHYPGRDGAVLERIARQAARIITISENTRADVLRLLAVPPERVQVVPHGYSEPQVPAATPALPVPDSYLLFTGSRALYKNFGCLVDALAELPPALAAGLHLVCAGGGPFTAAEQDHLRRVGWAARAHQFGPVTDAQLTLLYRGARAFVFPSLYEGFGLPILEAFGQLCPVVLSYASCFPEIAREAALYFNPHQPADLARQLTCALTEGPLRRQLVRLGQLRLLDFSWAETARRTRAVYEEALCSGASPLARPVASAPTPALEL